MGAFFPVGTFASLTGAGGGGGGAASATTGVGSAGAGAATTASTAGAAVAPDCFGDFDASTAGGAVFAAVFAGAAALAGAGLAGAGLAGAALAGEAALTEAALTGAGLTGAAALTGAGALTGAAATGLAAALAGATAVLAEAAFPGDVAGMALAAGALAAGVFGFVALALAAGATALADAFGFADSFAAPLGVRGDFMVVGDADRVGEGTGFALVTLAEARFTGTAVFAGAARVALVTGLAFVVFDEVDVLVAGAAFVDNTFFVAVAWSLVAPAAAFGLATPRRAIALGAAAFGTTGLPGFEAEGFPDLDGSPPVFVADLATVFFGTGAAFFAAADFAGLRAGIDFDDAATMYSR